MTIDRDYYIEYLILYTNKPREYWDKRDDREIVEEYSKLIKLD